MSNVETSQYYIKNALLSADRYVNCISLDITPLIVELHLFEDIRLPFVTGVIMVGDPDNTLDLLGFTGTEKLELTVKSNVNMNGTEVSKKFFVKSVVNVTNKKDMYVFTLSEESGFFWSTTEINKGYVGKIEHIIAQLTREWMNRDIDYWGDTDFKDSVQNEIIHNCAGKSLSELIPTFTQSICTDAGAPFFTFATLFDDNIQMASYTDILDYGPFNDCQPFVYSPTYMSAMIEEGNERAKFYNIIDFDLKDEKSDYDLYKLGTINADIQSLDIHTGEFEKVKFNPEEVADVISVITGKTKGRQFVYNPSPNITMNELNVKDTLVSKPTKVITSNSYPDAFSFTEKDFRIGGDKSIEKLWGNSLSIRKMLSQVMIPILIPGPVLFESKGTVGSIIDIIYGKEDESKQSNKGNIEDARLTGEYLITNIKHIFVDEQHMAQLMVVKLTAKEG